jgi:poly(3-hydroxybutyrate) depolymerase
MDSIQSLDNIDPHIASELLYTGSSPAWTCISDNRFCYFLYIPRNYYILPQSQLPLNLIVLVHGSGRNPYTLRREFSSFAETHSCALLAPLFPVGLIDAQDTVNYKYIKYKDIRYDQVLLAMIDEAAARFGRIDTSRFCLYGYSGGGQFVHRFAYLHPRRVRALACGAPGTQTMLNWEESFPDGVRDWEDVFGAPLDVKAVMDIPSMFVAGDQDTDIFYAIARGRIKDGQEHDQEVMARFKDGRYGATRRLCENWVKVGVKECVMVSVEGARHEERPMLESVKRFFEKFVGSRQ